MKSALEIAMERVSGLPELTPEEILEQREKEYMPVGEALGSRYMQDIIDEKSLWFELNRHQGDAGRIVHLAFISSLCRLIRLDDFHAADKALKGLLVLTDEGDSIRGEACNIWDRLLNDFKMQREKKFQEFELTARKNLASFGFLAVFLVVFVPQFVF